MLTSILSGGAAGVHLCIAVVLWLLSRAPGWQRVRRFIPVSLCATAYAALDLVAYSHWASVELAVALDAASILTGTAFVVAWLVYTFGDPARPWYRLPPRIRTLAAVSTVGGVLAAIPAIGIAARETPARQAAAVLSPAGSLLSLPMFLAGGVIIVTHLRRGRRMRSVGYQLGFLAYLAALLNEAGISMDLWSIPTMFDLGGVCCGLAVVASSVAEVVREANSMARSSETLADAVRTRTHELDEAREAFVESSRLAALGRLAAGVGHEINNPLMYVRSSLDLVHARADGLPEELRQAVADAREGTERIATIVADLRASGVVGEERRELLDVRAAVAAALRVTGHRLRGVELVEDLGPVPRVAADPQRLAQVFINLIINASQAIASTPGGQGRLVLRSRTTADGDACVEVIDTGPGIDAEVLPRLSEPYLTTRAADGGRGLGLYISRGIVTGHGGSLAHESVPGAGTTARVTLPAALRASSSGGLAAAERALGAPADAAPLRRLLVVDDDPLVLRALARQLRELELVSAGNGVEALEILARDDRFDAIVCDVMMPRMSGPELEAIVAERHPALRPRMLFLTGGATVPSAERFLARPDVRWLGKPASGEALLAVLARLADEAPRRADA